MSLPCSMIPRADNGHYIIVRNCTFLRATDADGEIGAYEER